MTFPHDEIARHAGQTEQDALSRAFAVLKARLTATKKVEAND